MGITPLVMMPRSVAHWRKVSWKEGGAREESIVGVWGGEGLELNWQGSTQNASSVTGVPR